MIASVRTTFLLGLGLSLVLVARSQIGGDQWNLLARGWLLVAHGTWIAHGNPTSAGGNEPGSFTALVVAGPLWLWMNHHAVALLVLMSHIVAYALLDAVVRRAAGSPERQLFALFYWLNPWRLYFSGHLWNPNFLFLAGAVHAYTAYQQRERARFATSFAHVAAIGLACQLHPSAIVLAFASLWLVWTRVIRLDASGSSTAILFIAASLTPWFHAVSADPSLLPIGHGFIGRGVVFVYPLARGLLYWIRYASLSVSGATPFDFAALLGPSIDRWLAPTATMVVAAIGAISVVPALMANRWALMRAWQRRRTRFTEPESGRDWLERYATAVFLATVLAYCLAPTTVMFWQGFVVLHAAVLPLVLWLGVWLRTPRAAAVERGLRMATMASIAIVILMAAGSPNYRCGGRDSVGLALLADYPMIHELHVDDTCAVPVDPDHGWAPDVFRPRGAHD